MSFIKSDVFNKLTVFQSENPKKLDFNTISEIQKELNDLLESTPNEVKNKLIDLEKLYKIDLTDSKEFIDNGGLNEDKGIGQNKPEAELINEGLIKASEHFIKQNPRSRKIKLMNSKYSANTSRRLSIKLIEEQLANGVSIDDVTLPFFIFSNYEKKGRVISKKVETKKSIPLINVFEEEDHYKIKWFGDVNEKKKLVDSYVESFYVYLFRDDNKREYLVLSYKEIDIGRTKIKGMLVRMHDIFKVGEKALLESKMDVIFLNEAEPAILPLTYNDARELTSTWEHEEISKLLFGEMRHPVWFEQLIASILFCSNRGYDGFPLHFGMLAERGTGKSSLLESLYEVFDEAEPMSDGTTATIKNLIPNFGGSTPDEGSLVKCFRIALVDEFVRALRRNKSNASYQDNETELITTILEHKRRMAGSGRHSQKLEIQASAKVIFASNPKRSVFNSIVEMVNVLDEAFMSRVLWYHQTKDHIKFIKSRESYVRSLTNEERYPKHNPEFVSLFDFLISVKTKIEMDKAEEIYLEVEKITPDALKGIWEARGRHIVYCLIDGVAKYRWVVDNRHELFVSSEDYDEAKHLLLVVANTWSGQGTIDLNKIPLNKKRNYLSGDLSELYDYICSNYGITTVELNDLKPVKSPAYNLKVLQEMDLVVLDDSVPKKIYPYWHKSAKDFLTLKNGVVVDDL